MRGRPTGTEAPRDPSRRADGALAAFGGDPEPAEGRSGTPPRAAAQSAGRGACSAQDGDEPVVNRWLEWALTSGLRIILIATAILGVLWLLGTVTGRLRRLLEGAAPSAEQAKRAATLTNIVRDLGVIAVVGVAGMLILAEPGMDLKPILTAAWIGGLPIGFGAQSLLKDVIGGFFLLPENQGRVGGAGAR